MEDFRALRYLAEKFYPEIPQFFYISVLVSVYKGNNAPGAGRHYSEGPDADSQKVPETSEASRGSLLIKSKITFDQK